MTTDQTKAAVVRLAAKTMRDDAATTPKEREVMRELIAMEDTSLVILHDALVACHLVTDA